MRHPFSHALSTAAGVALAGAALLAGERLLNPQAHAEVGGAPKPIIAVCSTPTLINELMQSDRFRPALEQTAGDARNELQDIAKELQTIRDGLQGADTSTPDAQQQIARFRELTVRASQLQQQVAGAVEEKRAAQLVECFDLVKASADAVAEHLGFDYVISTGSLDEQLSKTDSDATLRQITARPMIRFPKSADITDDVRDDLKLD